jgi:O-antigen ligase
VPASSLALLVLTVVAVGAPWAFGSVDPQPRFVLVLLSLGASAFVILLSWRRRDFGLPVLPTWPLAGLLALGLLQLAPMPMSWLRLLAPGSAALWHPADASVRSVLQEGFRPISIDPGATRAGLLLATGLIGLALLAVPALGSARTALRAANVVCAGGALLALYGIVARNRFGILLYGQLEVPTVSPFGPFVSKNHFAGYVAPACLFALGLALGLKGRSREREWTRDPSAPAVVLALVAALVMALSLFVSQSRGGVLAGVCGLLAFGAILAGLRRRHRRRALVPAALVIAVLLGLLAVTLPEAVRARVRTIEGASFRLEVWRDALALATQSPLVGHGFGAFADAFPRVKRGQGENRVEHAENEYVELLVEGGFIALTLAISAFLLPARRLLASLREMDPARRGLAMGSLAGLLALAVHSAFDFNLHIPSNAALAALLAAFAAASPGLCARPLPPSPHLAAGLLFGVAFFGVAAQGPRLFDPAHALRQARAEVRGAATARAPEVRDLRVSRGTAALKSLLNERPALAEGWLLLAALSRASGDLESARALARHALVLDPTRADLGTQARALQQP